MIDYEKIANAVNHYKKLGYTYLDVPWIVSLDSILVTRPPGVRLFSTFEGELVASGEQSFIEMRKGLRPGKYQCVTPCFRDETQHDELHKTYFLKNELIWILGEYHKSSLMNVNEVAEDALTFFSKYGDAKIIEVPLNNAFWNHDIMINGVEVGSYGFRQYESFCWVYGTGCAEPRLSKVLGD